MGYTELKNWLIYGEFSKISFTICNNYALILLATILLTVLNIFGYISISWFLVFAPIIFTTVVSLLYLGKFMSLYIKAAESFESLVKDTKDKTDRKYNCRRTKQ